MLTTNTTAPNEQASNKHFWHRIQTEVEPEKIWAIWTEVEQWQQWDTGLKSAALNEPFAKGAKGYIISLEGRKAKFKITDYKAGVSYTFKTRLFLSSLYVKRYLVVENGKTHFTHEVWFKGLLGGLFAKKMGPQFREMLPQVMENILEIAQK